MVTTIREVCMPGFKWLNGQMYELVWMNKWMNGQNNWMNNRINEEQMDIGN